MNVGDDVIIAGKIVQVFEGAMQIKVPSGMMIMICMSDIKSYAPKLQNDGVDKRRGN